MLLATLVVIIILNLLMITIENIILWLKVWDYQSKSCLQTLEGHQHNVTLICAHPELPIIITGSEDGTIRIWDATTYR